MKKNYTNTSAPKLKSLFVITGLLLFLVFSSATAQNSIKFSKITSTTVVPLFEPMTVEVTTPNLDNYQQPTGGMAAPPKTVPSFNPSSLVYLQAQTDRAMKDGTQIEWTAHSDTKPSRVVSSGGLHLNGGGDASITPMMSWNLQNSGFDAETVYLTVVITEPNSLVSFRATKEIYVSGHVN